MQPLPSLPYEIWARVFSYFECTLPTEKWWMYGVEFDHSPLKTLTSLSLVCRRFHQIARDLLYRTILLDGLNEKHEGDVLRFLARTLTADLQLGHKTRAVSLNSWAPAPLAGFKEAYHTVSQSLELAPRLKDRLMYHLFAATSDEGARKNGTAVVILAFMHNVQVVDCTLSFGNEALIYLLSGTFREGSFITGEAGDQGASDSNDGTAGSVVHQGYESVTTGMLSDYELPNLKEVRLRTGDCSEGTTGMSKVEAILVHPGLETLRLLGFEWTRPEIRKMRYRDIPSNIQFLQLKECIVDASSLTDIFGRFKNLHCLSIELADGRREMDCNEEDWEVDLDRFGQIFRESGKGLMKLDLHTIEYNTSHFADGRLGSLREMSSLRHLKVLKVDLLGRTWTESSGVQHTALRWEEALPQNLETLYIHFDDSYDGRDPPDQRAIDALRELIASGECPRLRQIKMERYLTDPTISLVLDIDGWGTRVEQKHLWQRYTGSGCLRSIMVFHKTK